MSPVVSGSLFSRARAGTFPSILDAKQVVHITSGRVALGMALEHAGIGPGDEVLLPAYHCESMITPVRWRGAQAVFYRICPNTAIDLEDMQQKLTSATRAVVVTHFFGFAQDIITLRAFCDKHNLVMIEDCAHAFFGTKDQRTLGTVGDYAIASTMKFFAVYDGGCLASNSLDINNIRLHGPRLSLQMKCAFNIVERALNYRRLGALATGINVLLRTKDLVWRMMKGRRNGASSPGHAPSSAEGAFEFDPAWMYVRISRASRWILSLSMRQDIATPRRRNFHRLIEATRNLPGCRPLYSALPDDTVPLVFPLYVDAPDTVQLQLRRQGVPIWRFGEFLDQTVDSTVCDVSVGLSRHLFQFPCHQELREDELEWMIERIRAVFLESGDGGRYR